jgi:hypothetical protein
MSEIKEDKSIWDQLMELKATTELTGVIHELQVYQLKIWAAYSFKDSSNTTVEIQIETTPKAIITFKVNLIDQPSLNLLNGLSRSIKSLLGDYFTFVVQDQSIVIFKDPGLKKKKRKVKDIIERLKQEDAN